MCFYKCSLLSTVYSCLLLDFVSPPDSLPSFIGLLYLLGFEAEEQWELYDTIFRNFGWIHCSLGNYEKSLHFFRRCVEIKRSSGSDEISPSPLSKLHM